jgi:hypothetical protein
LIATVEPGFAGMTNQEIIEPFLEVGILRAARVLSLASAAAPVPVSRSSAMRFFNTEGSVQSNRHYLEGPPNCAKSGCSGSLSRCWPGMLMEGVPDDDIQYLIDLGLCRMVVRAGPDHRQSDLPRSVAASVGVHPASLVAANHAHLAESRRQSEPGWNPGTRIRDWLRADGFMSALWRGDAGDGTQGLARWLPGPADRRVGATGALSGRVGAGHRLAGDLRPSIRATADPG